MAKTTERYTPERRREIADELERFAVDQIARGHTTDDDDETLVRAITALRESPETLVAEQQLLAGTVRVPDGWSWSDIGDPRLGGFTGYYSGIRLQKGEPVLEQDGHVLLIRQGETSFELKQADIYEKVSRLELIGEDGEARSAADVLVVHGFQGDRRGFTFFSGGHQFPLQVVEGAAGITAFVQRWLEDAHASPIIKRVIKRPPQDGSEQMEFE